MNKDEILEKARDCKKNEMDEYENHIYKTATRFSFFFMTIVCFVFMIIKIKFNQSYFDVLCITGIGLSIPYFYIGYKPRKGIIFNNSTC